SAAMVHRNCPLGEHWKNKVNLRGKLKNWLHRVFLSVLAGCQDGTVWLPRGWRKKHSARAEAIFRLPA
ncbi:MAG: hypothetical protein ACK5ES_26265, partial [Planctomyces sp.]